MDGVLTETSTLHAAAWRETFDNFLRTWATQHGQVFVPFDPVADYAQFVDGKPRLAGVRDFLASRHIVLPEGTESDSGDVATVYGVATQKNTLVQHFIAAGKAQAYPGSVHYVQKAVAAGLQVAVVSSSANTTQILNSVGLADLLPVRVDGVVACRENLPGKPAPDTFLRAAELLGVAPGQAAVFEDALAGVAAGRAGKFGYVIGVNRLGQAAQLRAAGADYVVDDLAQLLDDPSTATQQ